MYKKTSAGNEPSLAQLGLCTTGQPGWPCWHGCPNNRLRQSDSCPAIDNLVHVPRNNKVSPGDTTATTVRGIQASTRTPHPEPRDRKNWTSTMHTCPCGSVLRSSRCTVPWRRHHADREASRRSGFCSAPARPVVIACRCRRGWCSGYCSWVGQAIS